MMSWGDVKMDGVEDLDRTLQKLAKIKGSVEAEIVKVLSTVRNSILNTTKDGIDIDGKPFKSYSPKYMVRRADNHRQTRPVSLTWTGNMLRSMKVFRISNGGEIRFDSTRANDLAVKHNTGGRVPKREFFGLNKENIDYIEKKLADRIPL